MYTLSFVGFAALVLSFLLTPLVRNLFRHWGAVDHPDQAHKLHRSPVPRVGGIAIALAYGLSFCLLLIVPLKGSDLVVEALPATWRLLPAAILIFVTGLCDDLIGLKPWQKLAGQIAAACGAYWAGVHLTGFGGYHVSEWWALPLTILWLIACTNALNLIDGVDGLAAGVGLFAACTTLIAALLQQNIPLALATVPLAGALLGFLRFNFNPATIFLGDSGSLFIGFMLGCYGVQWSQKSATILGMTAPLLALSIPLLDTAVAIARRFLRQQPIFGADRGHIHHRLLDRGFTQRKVALLLYGCCCIGAICSLTVEHNNFAGPILILFCLITWIGIEHLGYVEFGVAGRMFVEGAFRRLLSSNIALQKFQQELAAARSPDDCWVVIHAASKDFGFHHVEMFLAGLKYEYRNELASDQCWNVRIPISDFDYIELTREFESGIQAGAVAPFADVLRKGLVPKLAGFACIHPEIVSGIHFEAIKAGSHSEPDLARTASQNH